MSDALALRLAAAVQAAPGGAPSPPSPPSVGRALGAALRGAVDALDAAGRPEGQELRRAVAGVAALLGADGGRALASGDVQGAAAVVLGKLLQAGQTRALDVVDAAFRRSAERKG